jgi:hypothetical protein
VKKKLPIAPPGRQVSASKTDLFLRCQYPWMPGLELPHDAGSEASLYGTAFHWLIGLLLTPGVEGKTRLETEQWTSAVDFAAKKWGIKDARELEGHVRSSYQMLRAWLKGQNDWGIDFLEQGAEVSVERSIALNPRLYLKDREGAVRDCAPVEEENHIYPDLKPNEIAGTVDLQTDLPTSGISLVLDHKTGHEAKDFAKPDENAQMLTLATGTPVPGGNRILAIYHADRRSLPVVHAQEVTQAQVDSHVQKLRYAQRRVGDGSMTPGWWCDKMYCPARSVCPAKAGSIVVATGAMLAEVIEDVTGELVGLEGAGAVSSSRRKPGTVTAIVRRGLEEGLTTAEDVGRFHYFKKEMERLMDMADREIKKWVEDNPDVRPKRPDGKVLIRSPRNVERLSKERIVAALGTTRAEKLFARLRRQGALETKVEMQLRAVFDE